MLGHSALGEVALGELPAGGVTVVVDAGSFVVSGQSAALSLSRRIEVDVGAFDITGQDASISTSTTIISSEVGAFTLSSPPVNLLFSRRFGVDPATFLLQGESISTDVTFGATLIAGTGVFVLEGGTINYSIGSAPHQKLTQRGFTLSLDGTITTEVT